MPVRRTTRRRLPCVAGAKPLDLARDLRSAWQILAAARRPPMTPLQTLLARYRATSQSEKEKGTYFEELIRVRSL